MMLPGFGKERRVASRRH